MPSWSSPCPRHALLGQPHRPPQFELIHVGAFDAGSGTALPLIQLRKVSGASSPACRSIGTAYCSRASMWTGTESTPFLWFDRNSGAPSGVHRTVQNAAYDVVTAGTRPTPWPPPGYSAVDAPTGLWQTYDLGLGSSAGRASLPAPTIS